MAFVRRNFDIECPASILQALQVIVEVCLRLASAAGTLQALSKPDRQLFRFVVVLRFTRFGCCRLAVNFENADSMISEA